MSVTSSQLKNSIPIEAGDVATTAFPGGLIASNLDLIWGMFADYGTEHPLLQYYFALRKAYDYLIGHFSRQVTMQIDGFKIDYTDTITGLKNQQADIDREIVAIAEGFDANYPLPELIARSAPIELGDLVIAVQPPNMPIDGNDSTLAGTPYVGLVPGQ